MKKMAFVFGLCAVAGCVVAPFEPPMGVVTQVKAPLSTEGNWKNCTKTGKASATSILGIVATGDCSIKQAADNGGLTTIEYLDYDYFNVLGIYQRVTVYAYGE